MSAQNGPIAHVHHHGAARAVGHLALPRRKTALGKESGVRIAQHAADGYLLRQDAAHIGIAEHPVAVLDFGERRHRHAKKIAQPLIPAKGMDIKELRARGVGIVGIKIARQPPYEIRIDGTEAHPARNGHIFQQPGIFRRREVGRERQPRPPAHQLRVGSERAQNILCTRTLPDDGVRERPFIVPDTARLPLIGDADGAHALRPLPHAFARHKEHIAPNFIEIVRDIPPPVHDLTVRHCSAGDDLSPLVKEQRLGALRALVDGKNVFHCRLFLTFAAMPSAVSP